MRPTVPICRKSSSVASPLCKVHVTMVQRCLHIEFVRQLHRDATRQPQLPILSLDYIKGQTAS